jgi:phosphoheptose isomerase
MVRRYFDVLSEVLCRLSWPVIDRFVDILREASVIVFGNSGSAATTAHFECDLCIVVPSDNIELIEDAHMAILHSIFREFV